MSIIASLLAGLLITLAALHLVWACRIYWPVRGAQAFIASFVGDPRLKRPPSALACIGVAFALFTAAIWATLLNVAPDASRLIGIGGIAIGTVFWLRGIAAYMPVFRRRFTLEPFATLDRWIYAPLCLVLGAGFFSLLLIG